MNVSHEVLRHARSTPDAVAVLDDVEIGKYHDYTDTYK